MPAKKFDVGTLSTPQSSNFAENQLIVMEELTGAIAEAGLGTDKKPHEAIGSDVITEQAGRILSNYDGHAIPVPVSAVNEYEKGL